MRRHLIGLALLGVVMAAPIAVAEESARPAIAIVDLDAKPAGRLLPPPQLGATAAQLLLDRLVESGRFRVYDGQWLMPRTEPQWRGTLAAIRSQALDANMDYVVTGMITRFTEEQKQRSVGGVAIPLPIIGGFRRQKKELVVSILLRLVDVRSGEVVVTAGGVGQGVRKNVSVGGIGFVRAGGGAGVSTGSSDARDAQLDEAIRRSVDQAAQVLIGSAPRLTVARR